MLQLLFIVWLFIIKYVDKIYSLNDVDYLNMIFMCVNPMSAMCPVFQGVQQNRINATEARIFWLALILCPLFWSMLFIVALFSFKFKWLLLVCIAIVLNGANLYGYVKCKMGNDQNISAATSDFIRKQVFQNVYIFMTLNIFLLYLGRLFLFKSFILLQVTSIMTRSPPTNTSNQPTNVI